MSITIYGAGAIGGVTGAALARAGHDVLLVDAAADHVAAMNAHGLAVDAPGGGWTARVRAVTPAALSGGLDLVLLAVKSQHTGEALDTLAPRLAPPATIVSLQNGLNEELIAARVGAARTVGCLVNWAADWVAPGRIQHGGRGAFVVGELDGTPSARAKELAALLDAVTDTRVTENIWGYKWAKHVYGALLVATALVDAHVYEVVERSPAVQRMLVALVAEGMRSRRRSASSWSRSTSSTPLTTAPAPPATPPRWPAAWRRSPVTTAPTPRPRPASGGTWRCGSARPRSTRTSAPPSPRRDRSVSRSR
ncbi:MAG TPA: 2-dehydropantoate 2-reductase N-terminal domain-containing protein [Methylomirabilota bacterium]|nr:2-dehydropantoate 2-reductase N-terminal domain-containing protein [Methylomirabilota bacterium]